MLKLRITKKYHRFAADTVLFLTKEQVHRRLFQLERVDEGPTGHAGVYRTKSNARHGMGFKLGEIVGLVSDPSKRTFEVAESLDDNGKPIAPPAPALAVLADLESQADAILSANPAPAGDPPPPAPPEGDDGEDDQTALDTAPEFLDDDTLEAIEEENGPALGQCDPEDIPEGVDVEEVVNLDDEEETKRKRVHEDVVTQLILDGAAQLEVGNADHFTVDGKPQVKALEALLDIDITAAQRDAAWKLKGE